MKVSIITASYNRRDTIGEAILSVLRQDYPSLPAQTIIKVYKDAASALKSIKSNKVDYKAKTPERKHGAIRLDKRLYSHLTDSSIRLNIGKNKRIDVQFHEYPRLRDKFDTLEHKDPLIYEHNGKLYLSIPFEVPVDGIEEGNAVGIDLGMRKFIVTSDGTYFDDKDYKAKRRKIRHNKSVLKSKKRHSHSARTKLKHIRHKERNMSKAMCEKAANLIIHNTTGNILVLEDLSKIKKNTSKTKDGFNRKKHNNALSQVPFYLFRQILSYKAMLAGKRVELVSAMYTSQTDSRAGRKRGCRRAGRRIYCPDGVVLDADYNAAINIGLRSKHPVSSGIPYESTLSPLTGRPKSTGRSSARTRCAAGKLLCL